MKLSDISKSDYKLNTLILIRFFHFLTNEKILIKLLLSYWFKLHFSKHIPEVYLNTCHHGYLSEFMLIFLKSNLSMEHPLLHNFHTIHTNFQWFSPWEIILPILCTLFPPQLLLILFIQLRIRSLCETYNNQASFHLFPFLQSTCHLLATLCSDFIS